MSVIAKFVSYESTPHALRAACLVACLLVQDVHARSGNEAIYFRATSLDATASVVLPAATAPQVTGVPFLSFDPLATSATIRARIAGLEDAGELYSLQMAELHAELGKALQAEGQHLAALDAYESSFQLFRRQQGLISASQAAVLQARMNSYLALGDFETTDTLQHMLLSMQQDLLTREPAALAAAYRAAADWNLRYYLQQRATPPPGGRSDAQRDALASRLGDAFMQYHQALNLLSDGAEAEGLYEARIELERKIAALMLMVNRQYQQETPSLFGKASHGIRNRRSIHPLLFSHGSAALQRAVEYSKATAEPLLVAERQLELGDWYLLMEQHDEARATYASAVTALREAGIPEAQIAAIVEAGLPVEDPERTLLALGGEGISNDFDGYIDVAFELNRYGEASNTRVLAGASYDEAIAEDLMRHINDGKFRPGLDQGTLVDQTEVKLRYYFAR